MKEGTMKNTMIMALIMVFAVFPVFGNGEDKIPEKIVILSQSPGSSGIYLTAMDTENKELIVISCIQGATSHAIRKRVILRTGMKIDLPVQHKIEIKTPAGFGNLDTNLNFMIL